MHVAMNKEERDQFFAALGRLAVMHRIKLDKPTARIYYDALQDIPIDLLLRAFNKLVTHAGEFMPKSEEIRAMVDEIQEDAAHAARVQQTPVGQHLELAGNTADTAKEPYFDCNMCGDTGMRPLCPGCNDPRSCDNLKFGNYCIHHKDGKYSIPVGACPCSRTNPTILRRQKALVQQRYARHRRDTDD